MKPNRKIDTQNVGELIQQLGARKITPTRFSIDLPQDQLANALYAAYVAEVNLRHRKMVLDEETKEHIKVAAQWLGDSNGKFGFMMTGLYGNGKTTLLMAMCNLINFLYDSACSNDRRSIRVLKAKDIARMAIDKNTRESYEKLYFEEMLAIDEIGEEPAEIISFGMVYTPIRDLLEERYARQKMTIITTNLVQSKEKQIFQIRDHYGERVVDRFREMMKILPFHNASYRPVL
jgi:DNA replication protein DnaC